jgi:hypothetical protein
MVGQDVPKGAADSQTILQVVLELVAFLACTLTTKEPFLLSGGDR